jgi:hypothetical protein
MEPGDLVFFWMAGADRGIYGWGHLTSAPYIKPDWDAHGVDVRYDYKFERPIRWDDISEDPALSNLLILRAPQATNFLLEPLEVQALAKLVERKGEKAPPELGGGL